MKIIQKKITDLSLSNRKALWSYALWWISGIFFLITAWDNKYVRFHAIQSTIFFGLMTLLGILSLNIGDYGWALGIFIMLVAIVMWKWLMWEAYHGETYKLAVIGKIAGRLANMEPAGNVDSSMPLSLPK